jgi:hypothetical protein
MSNDTQVLTLTDFLLARIAEDEWTWRNVYHGTNPMGTFLLAECDAKRRIVESCRTDHEYAQGRNDHTTELAEKVLWALALPYANHPDYRDECGGSMAPPGTSWGDD